MSDLLYAAYGSNLHPMRLCARIPAAQLMTTAKISGWGLRFHKRGKDGSGKCSIVAAEESVHVAVYAIQRADQVTLDRIEGVNCGYRHHAIEIAGIGTCYTYVAQDDYIDDDLQPFTWYRDLVVVGCEALQLPRNYGRRIAALDGLVDQDAIRAARHERLLRNARAAKLDYVRMR